MIFNACLPANIPYLNDYDKSKQKLLSFGAAKPVFAIKNQNPLKNFIPGLSFFAACISTLGYSLGSMGLFYDSYKENGNNIKKMFFAKKAKISSEEGVKTIKPITKIGEMGLIFAKIGITASAASGFTCGIGEGLPTMALGEATNIFAGPIIETPIGTGLFGIGIASIFSAYALENTPEIKLNHFKFMAEDKFSKKTKMVLHNIVDTFKEIGSSVFEMAKNIFNPKFFKENFLSTTPKTIVFQELINKDGKVTINKVLRHNKNYLMHAASFTLGLGGAGVVLCSLLGNKKAQKNSLYAEEGGFLFDNFGITKYGVDKLTTGSKLGGSGFALGGVLNSISQFMGLDNKNGRAMQWFGIALVFLGFSFDRGKHFKNTLANSKTRAELTDVVREWKFDLSKITDKNNPDELKKLLKELKEGKPITNEKFNKIEQTLIDSASEKFKTEAEIQSKLTKNLGKDISGNFKYQKIADFDSTQKALQICTEKIFGSKNPTPVP